MSMRRITLDITEDTAELLGVLGDAKDVITTLIQHAADGVQRPSSWERGWINQALLFVDWSARVEPDPDAPWRVRPKRREGEGQ